MSAREWNLAGDGEPGFVTWRRVVLWAMAPAVVIVSGAAGLVGNDPGAVHWLLLVLAGGLATVPAVMASRKEFERQYEARAAEDLAWEYETRLAVALGDAVTPIAHLLGRMAAAERGARDALLGQLVQRVVDAAGELSGGERTRAAYFAVEGDEMRCIAWAGRGDAPSASFVKGTPAGDIAHEIVRRRGHLFVPDISRPPPGVTIGPRVEYVSFLSVAVYAADRNYGLLSVDAVEMDALEDADVDVVRALAQLLGVGLAMTGNGVGD